ncbi:MAG: SET domain-containing protein [Candidatus Paceibacterota bacterium]
MQKKVEQKTEKKVTTKKLDKKSQVLKKGGVVSKEAIKNITKKVAKVGGVKASVKAKEERKLPDHHFKLVKAKRGLAGLGLFAEEPIKKGELIIEYIGDILNKEEADKKATSQYLFEINRNKTIDGTPRWNIARYCNHACEEAANAESEIKKGRVFIQAIKNIKEGEEIVYDYGEEFFKEHIAPHGCRCLAKKHSYGEETSK